MKITFLVGNGFDVGLGIKSSYSAFYNWYCDTPSGKKHIEKFKNDIKTEINAKEIPDDERKWADFESGIGWYTTRFTKETVEEYIDCYEDAQEAVARYLREQEQTFHPEDYTPSSFTSFQESLWKFYDGVSDQEKAAIKKDLDSTLNEHREINVISFNYTNTLERIFNKLPEKNLSTWQYSQSTYAYKLNRNIIHVHGTTKVFPILGVNDETQIENQDLLDSPQLQELLIKAKSVDALGQLWHIHAEEMISNSRFVCVLGMSIGKTDAKWWRKLVQWLKANEHRHLIIYWHEKTPPDGISIVKQLRSVTKVKDLLLSYSKLGESERAAIKNRIHIVINTKVFLQLPEKITPLPIKTEEIVTIEGIEKALAAAY